MKRDRAPPTLTGSLLLGCDCALAGLHQPQKQSAWPAGVLWPALCCQLERSG
jgi:hypothetical protein